MGKAISVIVSNEEFGRKVYPSIKAAAKDVEDYFERKRGGNRPSLGHGFSAIAKGEWIPKEDSQLFGWNVELNGKQ